MLRGSMIIYCAWLVLTIVHTLRSLNNMIQVSLCFHAMFMSQVFAQALHVTPSFRLDAAPLFRSRAVGRLLPVLVSL